LAPAVVSVLFSEPKIPQLLRSRCDLNERAKFQCSSASRKFLNHHCSTPPIPARRFQCSSASRKFLNNVSILVSFRCCGVSVLFSEPKIPQFVQQFRRRRYVTQVSVLFSEPKIPQSWRRARSECRSRSFSALQRAENSSMPTSHCYDPQ